MIWACGDSMSRGFLVGGTAGRTTLNGEGLQHEDGDYMKVLPASIARWVPGDLVCLGTDGSGLSESRPVIRDHFGVSAEYIIRAAGGEA